MTLKVIGAGFGRTGTASLKLALETLLGGPCYHMTEVLGKPGQVDLWIDVATGNPDWDAIFDGYAATVDYPACNYWRELAVAYPDAKIVLSVRSPESWFESTQKTIFSERIQGYQKGTKWGEMCLNGVDKFVGGDLNDREAVIAAFNAHNEEVKSAFGPDRVLVFEAKDGWEPLCAFLGMPVPDEPYPNINSNEEFEGIYELLDSPIGPSVMNGEGIPGGPNHEDMLSKGEND